MSLQPNKPADPVVLRGDGSYEFTARIDGNDLVVSGVSATWFGGAHDPQDNGETASGVNTKKHPDMIGCALPMNGYRLTSGSPLPTLPYIRTQVQVTRPSTGKSVTVPLIDLGPGKPPHAHAAIDLTVATFQALGGDLKTGRIAVEYRVIGGALHLPVAMLATAKAAAGISGGKKAVVASGGTAAAALLAVPLALAAIILGFPLAVEASLSPEVLVVLSGLIGLAIVAKLVTGLLVDAKKLRETPTPAEKLPSPLVVRAADQFVTQEQITKFETDVRNQMVELRRYVHDAVHEIKGLAHDLNLAMREQSETTHDFFVKLDAKNEERVQRIANRVDEVIDRTPGKIIDLLRNTGALKP